MKTRILPLLLRGMLAAVLAGSAMGASAQPARGPQSFSAVDTDGDGFISREEFDAARAQRMQGRAAQGGQMRGAATAPSFDSLDANRDGKLSAQEFAAGQQGARQAQRGQRGGGPGAGRGAGRGAGAGAGRNMPSFQDYDLNADGSISADEFEQARTKRISERASAGYQMRGLADAPGFEEIDANHDGSITPDEFQSWQAQRRQQAPRRR